MRVENSGAHGDIKVLEVMLDEKDITLFVNIIQIFQDIFIPCWSISIIIEDSANILMTIPIRPGSKLTVKIETSVNSVLDGEKTFEFIIYKIGDKVSKGQMHYQYTLYGASESFIKNQQIRIQKTYANKKPEEAVGNIVQEFLGGSLSNSDRSDINFHVIIPNWNPFIACWWYAKVALKENRSDYVFFMKDNNQYWFKSIEVLYTNEDTGITFKQLPTGFRNEAGDIEEDYCIMINKYEVFHFDSMANLSTGFYGTKVMSYDVINKKWSSKSFNYGDDLEADKEKKSWDIFDGSENANINFLPKHPGMHSNSTINDQIDNWQPSRKSRLMKLEQDKLQIQFPGGGKVWDFLGKKCKVDLPSKQDIEDEKLDKFFKGDYLISHVQYFITQNNVVNNLELIKIRHEQKMTSGG